MADENFDLAQSSAKPKGATRPGIPHAYGFIYHSILGDNPPPSVPIILNVHFPHNQPKLHRCLALGRALHRAIESYQGCRRVAIIASGGLTHFVIDEDLDRQVLTAMEKGDENALAELPENVFKVGTAEIKNWYPVIAAMNAAGKRFHQVDYVPCYRSEAGTGNAMAFVYWE
jgi:OH-DDVA oxygenase